ncbi:hypothetical protein Tco_0005618 [Tanacetum coccineum]
MITQETTRTNSSLLKGIMWHGLGLRRIKYMEDLNLYAPNETTIMMGSVLPSAPTVRGMAIWSGTGHYKKDCPKLKNKNQGNQVWNDNAVARAYAVGTAGTNPNSNVVTGRNHILEKGQGWLEEYQFNELLTLLDDFETPNIPTHGTAIKPLKAVLLLNDDNIRWNRLLPLR